MKEKIEEFRSLGRKEAKAALESYAKEEFGINLNKQRSFDNMVVDLEAELTVRGIETDLSASDEPEAQVPASEPEVEEPAGDVVETPVTKPVHQASKPEPVVMPMQGYIQIPYWVYDFIKANPDWKQNVDKCGFYGAKDVLTKLKHIIELNGSVTVRETRNSRFEVIV